RHLSTPAYNLAWPAHAAIPRVKSRTVALVWRRLYLVRTHCVRCDEAGYGARSFRIIRHVWLSGALALRALVDLARLAAHRVRHTDLRRVHGDSDRPRVLHSPATELAEAVSNRVLVVRRVHRVLRLDASDRGGDLLGTRVPVGGRGQSRDGRCVVV